MNAAGRLTALSLLLLTAACAGGDKVLLLPPEPGAAPGSVAVLSDDGKTAAVIDTPNTEARLGGASVEARAVDPGAVQDRYGSLIDTLPAPPAVFVLYFREGTVTLTPESRPALDALLAEVGKRPGAEVQVTGHTDRVGHQAANDALSVARATEVASMLVAEGLDPALLVTAGRGEREPLVPTADGVREPRNRRVAITVR